MRYVIDAPVAIQLARDRVAIAEEHSVLAPTLIRSQVLSQLYGAVVRGELTDGDAREHLDVIRALHLRLLGDRVLQNVAWTIARQLGWSETYDAEYLALTQLQADAFVTLDPDLARAAEGIVTIASIDDVLRNGRMGT